MSKTILAVVFALFLAQSLVTAQETPKPSADMVYVEGGTFRMGDTFGDGDYDEKPAHDVTLSGFSMGKCEVTVGEFRQFVTATGYKTSAETSGGGYVFTGNQWERNADANWRNPLFPQDDRHPVVLVSRLDAVEYCNWKSRSQGLEACYVVSGPSVDCDFTKNGYRLPTEAEWEYVARSRGKAYRYSWGDGSPSGNVADESLKKQISDWTWPIWTGYDDGYAYTAPVGGYAANEVGLYDMTGNVWEWCWDWYGSYPDTAQDDPKGAAGGTWYVLRGGSWFVSAADLSASNRSWCTPDGRDGNLGFRVVRSEIPAKAAAEPPKVPAEMVSVEGGTFLMGDTFGDGHDNEEPIHEVTVSGIRMGNHEVTQREWREVMGTIPSYFEGDDLPVERISWDDAVEYCNKLSAMKGLEPCYTVGGTNVTCDFTKNGYRLPTEAEWEYAARGGKKASGNKYSGGNHLGSVGWYDVNSGDKTHPVGTRQANELGLYDMTGNAWEWCWDWYGSYGAASQNDPKGAVQGEERVRRGGSCSGNAWYVRASVRGMDFPSLRYSSLGFRVVRSGSTD